MKSNQYKMHWNLDAHWNTINSSSIRYINIKYGAWDQSVEHAIRNKFHNFCLKWFLIETTEQTKLFM